MYYPHGLYRKDGINGRLKSIVFNRWGNPDFKLLAKEYFNYNYMYKNQYQWRTGGGHLFEVDLMGKKHIVNTLNCLTGKKKKNPIPDQWFVQCIPNDLNRQQWIDIFLEELKKYT
jgi:hypothetical protein